MPNYIVQGRRAIVVEARRSSGDAVEAFFDERRLIPQGSYHEIAFEDLEQEPLGQLRKLYAGLNLPDFQSAEAGMRQYIDTLHGHKRNEFPVLPHATQVRISNMWRLTIDEWGYAPR